MTTFLVLVVIVLILYAFVAAVRSSVEQPQQSPAGRASGKGARYSSPSRTRSQRDGMADAVREGEKVWVPPGQTVTVAGYEIPDGMLYVGRHLPSLRDWGAPDPALVDPGHRVSRERPDRSGQFMRYWPSYADIPPTSRAAYLEWLAGGRRDPDAYIGYVFLFFYGIERRVLLDAQHSERAAREVPILVEEVEHLLDVYGSNHSFRSYASGFVDVCGLLGGPLDTEQILPPSEHLGWDYPLSLKIALGAMSKAGETIPSEWALSWLRCAPHASLRTPAVRCRDEFDQLFRVRYEEKHGVGIRVKPNKRRLSMNYRAASATFPGPPALVLPDLPDVTSLEGPLNRLRKLADGVCGELDGFSRWVGRNGDRTSPAALALLPPELVRERMGGEADAFIRPIEEAVRDNGIAVVNASDLVANFPSRNEDKLTKKEAAMLAEFFAGLGYGIEPDVRHGGPNLSASEYAAVFQLAGPDESPSDAYQSATVLLHLGAAVAAADNEITAEEEQRLEEHLERSLQLSSADRTRLRAHLKWLLAAPPNLNGLKRRVAPLSEELRHEIGRFLIIVAGADGYVSPDELRLLSKLYPLLGLAGESVYGDVHAMAAGGAGDEDGPVAVLPADQSTDYSIPARDRAAATGIVLDMSLVDLHRQKSREAAEVLEKIFAGDSALDDQPTSPEHDEEADTLVSMVRGLDETHSSLLRVLAQRHRWERSELATLADQHGLMPAGAVEIINEAAFEVCGEPILEGDDPIDVNPYALEELLS